MQPLPVPNRTGRRFSFSDLIELNQAFLTANCTARRIAWRRALLGRPEFQGRVHPIEQSGRLDGATLLMAAAGTGRTVSRRETAVLAGSYPFGTAFPVLPGLSNGRALIVQERERNRGFAVADRDLLFLLDAIENCIAGLRLSGRNARSEQARNRQQYLAHGLPPKICDLIRQRPGCSR
jgi:hypothetical protein